MDDEKNEEVEETSEETVDAIDEVTEEDGPIEVSEEAVEEEKDTTSDVLDEIVNRLDVITDSVSELLRSISAIALSGGGNMASENNVNDALGDDDGEERDIDDDELIEMFAKANGDDE